MISNRHYSCLRTEKTKFHQSMTLNACPLVGIALSEIIDMNPGESTQNGPKGFYRLALFTLIQFVTNNFTLHILYRICIDFNILLFVVQTPTI